MNQSATFDDEQAIDIAFRSDTAGVGREGDAFPRFLNAFLRDRALLSSMQSDGTQILS